MPSGMVFSNQGTSPASAVEVAGDGGSDELLDHLVGTSVRSLGGLDPV